MPRHGLHLTARQALAGAALWLVAGSAAAHQTLHEVRRGAAVAVRAFEPDGAPVASTAYQVYSPADPKQPWQEGRTDRAGWLAFVPSGPGIWRVRVIEATGHGLDVEVEIAPPPVAPPAGAVSGPASPASPPADASPTSGAASLLRPLIGLAVLGVVFAALFLAWRKKDGAPSR